MNFLLVSLFIFLFIFGGFVIAIALLWLISEYFEMKNYKYILYLLWSILFSLHITTLVYILDLM